jgi:hypothetical protein
LGNSVLKVESYNEEDYERIKNKIVDEYVHEIEKLIEKIKEEVIDHDVWN